MIEAFEPTALQIGLLALVGFVAGTFDAIAGGGGLITVPAILATGLPVHAAFGTNKAQSVFGSGAALVRFFRAGLVDRSRFLAAFGLGLAGSAAGTALQLQIPPDVLRPVALGLLATVAIALAFRPSAITPAADVDATVARRRALLAAFLIGTYDGFFGPGTGTFLILAFVLLSGETPQKASANAKVVNFASNLASVCVFIARGKVVWACAIPMAAAQFAGGFFGAHLAVRVGDRLVRRVMLVVVLGLVAKLGWDLLK